jgi:hypothetical protein
MLSRTSTAPTLLDRTFGAPNMRLPSDCPAARLPRAAASTCAPNPARSRSPSPEPSRHSVLGRDDRDRLLPGFASMREMEEAGFYGAAGPIAMKSERDQLRRKLDLGTGATREEVNQARWGTHVTPGDKALDKLGACKCLEEDCPHTWAYLGQWSTTGEEGKAKKMCGAWGDSSWFGDIEDWTGTPGEADRRCYICAEFKRTKDGAYRNLKAEGGGRKRRKSKKKRTKKRTKKRRTKKKSKKRSKNKS